MCDSFRTYFWGRMFWVSVFKSMKMLMMLTNNYTEKSTHPFRRNKKTDFYWTNINHTALVVINTFMDNWIVCEFNTTISTTRYFWGKKLSDKTTSLKWNPPSALYTETISISSIREILWNEFFTIFHSRKQIQMHCYTYLTSKLNWLSNVKYLKSKIVQRLIGTNPLEENSFSIIYSMFQLHNNVFDYMY